MCRRAIDLDPYYSPSHWFLAHHSATWAAATCRTVIATIPEPAVCSPRLDLTPRVNLGPSVAPILSRAVDDPALSDEILEATATELGRR